MTHPERAAEYDTPDAAALLDGVARFLHEDLRGAVRDPALAFRLRVAESLVAQAARESRGAEGRVRAAAARLREVLPEAPPADGASPREELTALEGALAAKLRRARWREADLRPIAERVGANLRDSLAVTNPRFDPSPDVEGCGGREAP